MQTHTHNTITIFSWPNYRFVPFDRYTIFTGIWFLVPHPFSLYFHSKPLLIQRERERLKRSEHWMSSINEHLEISKKTWGRKKDFLYSKIWYRFQPCLLVVLLTETSWYDQRERERNIWNSSGVSSGMNNDWIKCKRYIVFLVEKSNFLTTNMKRTIFSSFSLSLSVSLSKRIMSLYVFYSLF